MYFICGCLIPFTLLRGFWLVFTIKLWTDLQPHTLVAASFWTQIWKGPAFSYRMVGLPICLVTLTNSVWNFWASTAGTPIFGRGLPQLKKPKTAIKFEGANGDFLFSPGVQKVLATFLGSRNLAARRTTSKTSVNGQKTSFKWKKCLNYLNFLFVESYLLCVVMRHR